MENGDSPLVAAMFREIGNLRNFKQMTLRLNMASLKDMRSQKIHGSLYKASLEKSYRQFTVLKFVEL
ncbi:unnamed protein product [Cylicostephanus goldi]|uniref:Uncharacterized protein n=1 Tax=Cylicostephanus goldi TaxID=71465 RepID=A0A3P6RU01_CYLGO|nr:unnamed protein product [Cylicostephanus goldi]